MRALYWIVVICTQGVLWLLIALPLWRYVLSEFTAKQRVMEAQGAHGAKLRWLFRFRDYLAAARLSLVVLLALLTVVLLTQLYTPWVGFIGTIILLVVAVWVARIAFLERVSEQVLLSKLSYVQTAIRFTSVFLTPFIGVFQKQTSRPDSYDEFLDQLRRLPSTVIAPQQKQRIETVLNADTKTVKDIMTPKKRVVTVEPGATLGPIVLSDLQKSGHGYFPVATKKGEPEGILALHDIADIHQAKQRSHVREVMKEYIVWAEESDTLITLTQRLLKEKQHLMLVRNETGAFSGVVTTADIITHLTSITEEQ